MISNIVTAILVILVLVFVIQNTQVVQVEFMLWKVSMSRALLLLVTFVIGVVTGWVSRRAKARADKTR